jgi:hypothetical protein
MEQALDFVAEYTSTDAGIYLTTDRQGGLLMFSTPPGWISIALDRDQLAGLKDRVAAELNRKPPLPKAR